MKGITKVGTLVALVGGATIFAINAQPAEAHDGHWYRERAAQNYWHHERWLADHAAYGPSYVYAPYAAPVYVRQAPLYRRIY